MSTALRIIILVVEILAYIAIFGFKNRWLNKKEDYTDLDKTKRYIEFGSTIIILLLGIIFLFPAHVFLSYKKIAVITVFIIIASIWFLNNKLRNNFYKNQTAAAIYVCITLAVLGGSIIAISSSTSSVLEPDIFVSYDYTSETYDIEELKNIGDRKIVEVTDEKGKISGYFFICEDENGNEIVEIVKPSELWYDFYNYPDEYAYIEKYKHTSIHSYPEKKISTETKEFFEYRFYINENLLTKIEM